MKLNFFGSKCKTIYSFKLRKNTKKNLKTEYLYRVEKK